MLELNRIYNMDCMIGLKQIDDSSVDMILTDIPYGEVSRKSAGLRNLDKGDADIETFDLAEFMQECMRVCTKSIYVFCGTAQTGTIRNALNSKGYLTRHCVWEKTNPSPMNGEYTWLSSIENCIYGRAKGAIFNEHCKSVVWRFPVETNQRHPTQKPIKLFEYLIRVSTNMNGIVLDPCMGSGTTAFAALKQDRKFIGFEINSEYCRQADRRIDMERRQVKLWGFQTDG